MEEIQEAPKQEAIKQSKLPKSLTTVTKASKLLALFLFVILPFAGFYLGMNYQSNQISDKLRQKDLQIQTLKEEAEENKKRLETQLDKGVLRPSTKVSTTESLPHENLPGFNIDLLDGWTISEVAQFRNTDENTFYSRYFTQCGTNCMGIRISKNQYHFDLIFDIIFDDYGQSCSDSVAYENIGNDWYKIHDSSSYLYTKKIDFDTTIKYEFNNHGSLSDEWSYIKDHEYKVCLRGSGSVLKEDVPESLSPDGVVMLEHVMVPQIEDGSVISEIDYMIKSIEGV